MPNAFRMTIGAEPGAVARVGAAFAQFADANALPATVRRSVNVALDELLTNTLVHGFADWEGRAEVGVEVELQADRLVVTLTDNGAPFDPFGRAAPDTGLSVEERGIGGLGIHLVKKMMDEAGYRRLGDKNVVVLSKLLGGGRTSVYRGGGVMEITTRTQGAVTIVGLAGNLDSHTSPQAQTALDGILAGGAKKIVLDFTALDYISSAGLRVMLGTAKKLGGGGALRLFGLNDTVREVFEISGFASILNVVGTEAEALRGL